LVKKCLQKTFSLKKGKGIFRGNGVGKTNGLRELSFFRLVALWLAGVQAGLAQFAPDGEANPSCFSIKHYI
jgi:hypothetical protein